MTYKIHQTLRLTKNSWLKSGCDSISPIPKQTIKYIMTLWGKPIPRSGIQTLWKTGVLTDWATSYTTERRLSIQILEFTCWLDSIRIAILFFPADGSRLSPVDVTSEGQECTFKTRPVLSYIHIIQEKENIICEKGWFWHTRLILGYFDSKSLYPYLVFVEAYTKEYFTPCVYPILLACNIRLTFTEFTIKEGVT